MSFIVEYNVFSDEGQGLSCPGTSIIGVGNASEALLGLTA
jgi:hypothetical protein